MRKSKIIFAWPTWASLCPRVAAWKPCPLLVDVLNQNMLCAYSIQLVPSTPSSKENLSLQTGKLHRYFFEVSCPYSKPELLCSLYISCRRVNIALAMSLCSTSTLPAMVVDLTKALKVLATPEEFWKYCILCFASIIAFSAAHYHTSWLLWPARWAALPLLISLTHRTHAPVLSVGVFERQLQGGDCLLFYACMPRLNPWRDLAPSTSCFFRVCMVGMQA